MKGSLTCVTAPAHPYATDAVVYTALFIFQSMYIYSCLSLLSLFHFPFYLIVLCFLPFSTKCPSMSCFPFLSFISCLSFLVFFVSASFFSAYRRRHYLRWGGTIITGHKFIAQTSKVIWPCEVSFCCLGEYSSGCRGDFLILFPGLRNPPLLGRRGWSTPQLPGWISWAGG